MLQRAAHLGAGPLVGGDNVFNAGNNALIEAIGRPRLEEALVHCRAAAAEVAAPGRWVRHLPCLHAHGRSQARQIRPIFCPLIDREKAATFRRLVNALEARAGHPGMVAALFYPHVK